MRNPLLGLGFSLSALVLSACSGVTPPPPGSGDGTSSTTSPATSETTTSAPTEPSTTSAPATTTPPPGDGKMCGGIAGLPCPKGKVCVDDPSDSCDPATGGRDCSGMCVNEPDVKPPAGNKACDKPARKYVAKDTQKCAAIRYFCEAGYVAFHDDCGCGCEPAH